MCLERATVAPALCAFCKTMCFAFSGDRKAHSGCLGVYGCARSCELADEGVEKYVAKLATKDTATFVMNNVKTGKQIYDFFKSW